MKDTLSGFVAYRVGDSPVGPSGEIIPVYYTPEKDQSKNIITYNAKAHPHLSQDGELLISYNVNSTDWNALDDVTHNFTMLRCDFTET